jgi:UDP-galactopyranose mutase
MRRTFDILTFSHLRWDFVFQRPQHLLSRLGKDRRVLFVEEPIFSPGEPYWEKINGGGNVLVCRPHTPVEQGGFCDAQMPALKMLMAQLVREEQLSQYVAWFYTPMALPLAAMLVPQAVVYDCMDELSAFLHAPRQLLDNEAQLLALSDLVFTGGPSLYRAKKNRHPNVHCFSSSVDAEHFSKARTGEAREPARQAALPGPRLGFFGVIDERINLHLIAHLADAHPEWQIVMVGPVVKIDPAALPKRANIHYFGQQQYDDLPGFLAGWDLCLLPFAQNESTKFISPTKTLEYMAAERLIVSTPITDVEEPYGKIVYLGETAEAFTSACEIALRASASERATRVKAMGEVLQKTSWDATAKGMEELIESTIRISRNPEEGVFVPVTAKASEPAVKSNAVIPTVVIGAGPTGLSAAYHLGKDALLVEQNSRVGGWCRSIEDKGFTFDFAGHIMFSNDPYVHELYKMLLGDNVHWQDREAWIFSKNVYTRYPFQGALYGLPPEVIQECIVGAIEARFGPIAKPAVASSKKASSSASECKAESITDVYTDVALESAAPAAGAKTVEPKNFEEFIYKVWGAGIAKHFAVPYNRKLWAVPLKEMETSWLGGRVPVPDLGEMIEGALRPVGKPMGPNARFGYPLHGGFQALMNGFLPHLKGELRLNTKVKSISPSAHSVTLNDGTKLNYQSLVSTMPLPVLIRTIGDEAPPEIHEAAQSLRNVSVRCVNIGVGRENLTEKHWIYYPEDSVFHRIFVQGNASPHCNPAGGFGLTCEITYSEYKPLPCDGAELIERCIQDCIKVGFFTTDDVILTANQVDMPYAYVVYDHGRAASVAKIRDWLGKRDIVLAGRYSEWEYYNSDHAFLAGRKAAERVREMEEHRATKASGLEAFQVARMSAQGN